MASILDKILDKSEKAAEKARADKEKAERKAARVAAKARAEEEKAERKAVREANAAKKALAEEEKNERRKMRAKANAIAESELGRWIAVDAERRVNWLRTASVRDVWILKRELVRDAEWKRTAPEREAAAEAKREEERVARVERHARGCFTPPPRTPPVCRSPSSAMIRTPHDRWWC